MLVQARRPLVEASPYDQIWGIGLSADDPLVRRRETWRGDELAGRGSERCAGQLARPEAGSHAALARTERPMTGLPWRPFCPLPNGRRKRCLSPYSRRAGADGGTGSQDQGTD